MIHVGIYKGIPVRTILIYGGGYGGWEEEDQYTDYGGLVGINFNFRSQWGFEINLDAGKSKDLDVKYNSYNASLSAWFHTSPKWHANFYAGYSRTYNFIFLTLALESVFVCFDLCSALFSAM